MKYIMLLLSALAGVMLSSAISVSDDLFDPIANFSVIDIEWIVPISPDRNDTVVGTIEDVARHLSVVDPERFAAINASIYEGVAAPFPDRPTASYIANDDDGLYNPSGHTCGIYDDAKGVRIKYGIEYLRKVPGTPGVSPGKDVCGRVSCSYNSAIWWCNWSNQSVTLDSYGRIADGAQDLMTSCTFIQDDGHIGNFAGNQAFGTDDSGGIIWMVVVRKNSC